MRTKTLLPALSFVILTCGAASAQQPPPAQPPKTAPPQTQPPVPGAPYKPDFDIPKPEGPNGAPKTNAANQTTPGEGYVIGPQDSLAITVADEVDLTTNYKVDSDGTITMNYLNRVPLGGLSLAEAQDKVTALLKTFLRNPQVRIEVKDYKARSVLMTGEVRNQGKVLLTGATMSLLEALAMAGSATANASNEVLIMHQAKNGEKPPEPITVNRKDLELGKVGRDITLQDGDIVNVPIAKRFYISGFIKNNGSYVLDPGTTVGQAIILAGGLADRGSDRRIKIGRIVDGKSVEIEATMETRVLPNDEIKIKSRFF